MSCTSKMQGQQKQQTRVQHTSCFVATMISLWKTRKKFQEEKQGNQHKTDT